MAQFRFVCVNFPHFPGKQAVRILSRRYSSSRKIAFGASLNQANLVFQGLDQNPSREREWKRWGPYASERVRGMVRRDCSPFSNAWEAFPHDQAWACVARTKAVGPARRQMICFAIALRNGHDHILKQRVFGLTGNESNHGEDLNDY